MLAAWSGRSLARRHLSVPQGGCTTAAADDHRACRAPDTGPGGQGSPGGRPGQGGGPHGACTLQGGRSAADAAPHAACPAGPAVRRARPPPRPAAGVQPAQGPDSSLQGPALLQRPPICCPLAPGDSRLCCAGQLGDAAAGELALLASAVRFLAGQAPVPLGAKSPPLALAVMEAAFPVLAHACTHAPWAGHAATMQAVCEVWACVHPAPMASAAACAHACSEPSLPAL